MKNFIALFSKEKISVHVILLALSGICSITLINILFSLAMNTKFFKAGAILIGFLLVSTLFYYLYFQFIRAILPDVAKHWLRNSLTAIVLTFIILSLTPMHLPYYPVEHEIQISTTSPALSFSHVTRNLEDAPLMLIKAEDFEFIGAWNYSDGFSVHQGNQPGKIHYRKVEFVRESLSYHFSFLHQKEPTSAIITIDDDSYVVEIDASDEENKVFGIAIEAPQKLSISRFWHYWILIFPHFYRLTLFILVFFGASFILAQKEKWLQQGLHLLFFTVLLYLFWLTLNYQNPLFNFWTIKPIFPLIALLFFFVIPFFIIHFLRSTPKSKKILLILIFLLAAGLRIYWIIMVPTAQVSDFGKFHHWALQLASGEPGLMMDRYTNFTRILSLLYRVFPTDSAVEVLNVVFSLGTMLYLYLMGKINYHEEAGIIAAYLFAVFPSQISMVTIVGTDIPSVFFLVMSVYLMTYFAKREKLIYLMFSAASFGLAYIIRGALLIYFPVLFLPFIFSHKKKVISNLLPLSAILVGFGITVSLATGFINHIKVDEMIIEEGRYVVWPLVKGTNVEKLGRNNAEDTLLVASWPVEDVTRNGLAVVAERVFTDPISFYQILDEKFEFMFADATYGSNLSFYDETHEYFDFQTGWDYEIEAIREGFAQLSQYAYLCVLLAAVLVSLKYDSSLQNITLPSLLILVCALGAYAFFEVQPRYHRPIIPSLILLAALFFAYHTPQKDQEANRIMKNSRFDMEK